jgi:TonB family protein
LILTALVPMRGVAGSSGPKAEIVAPRLLEDPGAAYPGRALDERYHAEHPEPVEVALVLELTAEGNVERATVETPRGHGFDEAALEAARRLRFVPATRGGKPVAAKIRYRYVFDRPPPPPPRAPTSAPGPGAPAHQAEAAAPARPGTPEEVIVRGRRHEPTGSSYTRAEVRLIPGAFGDPFRAVDTLPGVTPLATGLPFFYVRGAPPGNVGYFLDGVRVPYLYHIGAGPSVVQPAMVDRVDVYPGAYPARFGRFAGGIVSADTNEPVPEFHGEATLRLFDVGGLVETGFAGGRGTVLLGGRYSYTGALLSVAAPEVHLDYRDFQARISYDLTSNDSVSVFGFGAYDLLEQNRILRFGSEFYRADVRYDHQLAKGRVRTAVTLGYDRTNAAVFLDEDKRAMTDRSIGLRTEVDTELAPGVMLRTGANATLDAYRLEGATYVDVENPENQPVESMFQPRIDHATGAWVDLTLDASRSVQIRPGLRADLFGSGGAAAVGVDPRLSASFEVTDGVRLIPAVGYVHQPPSFVVPLPGIAPPLGDGLQRSLQTSGAAEVDLGDATTLGSALFYNLFWDMTDAFGTSHGDAADFDIRSQGYAYGAEFFLRRRLTKRFGGFVSYTLSRSVRSARGHGFVSAFDRTHVANAAFSYELGRGWRVGSRFLFYTGTPRWNEKPGEPIVSGTSGVAREPSFYRVDLRIEKRWGLRGSAWISFVAEFLNATLHKEVWPGGDIVGPISIPSLGVEAGF